MSSSKTTTATYQSIDVVVVNESDSLLETTGDGMISSSTSTYQISSKKNCKSVMAILAAVCVVSFGLSSWNSKNDKLGSIAGVELLGLSDEPESPCDDELIDDDGCFKLSFCESTDSDIFSNYVSCYSAHGGVNILNFDLYNDKKSICPKVDKLNNFLFGEDYVVDHCYDGHCVATGVNVDCSIDNISHVSLECDHDAYGGTNCKVCKHDHHE